MANVSEGTGELWTILRLLPMSLAATKTKHAYPVASHALVQTRLAGRVSEQSREDRERERG